MSAFEIVMTLGDRPIGIYQYVDTLGQAQTEIAAIRRFEGDAVILFRPDMKCCAKCDAWPDKALHIARIDNDAPFCQACADDIICEHSGDWQRENVEFWTETLCHGD